MHSCQHQLYFVRFSVAAKFQFIEYILLITSRVVYICLQFISRVEEIVCNERSSLGAFS